MKTALFLSLFGFVGNPPAPATNIRLPAIVQPGARIRVAQPAPAPIVPRASARRIEARPSPVPTTPLRAELVRRVAVPTTSGGASVTPDPAGSGRFSCDVVENGVVASASYRVLDGGTTVLRGRCLSPAESLPAGSYQVEVTLDGTADRATRTLPLRVVRGEIATARAEFETSRVTVNLVHDGDRLPGRATLKRNGRVVGHLGTGVYGVVSAGRYEIEVAVEPGYDGLYGSRTVTLDLAPGQVRSLDLPF